MRTMLWSILAGLGLLGGCEPTDGNAADVGTDVVVRDGDEDGHDQACPDECRTDAGVCVDECPMPTGITWRCKRRFVYGVNYPWYHFGGDFGGISEWGISGVAANIDTYRAHLQEMRDHGVSVVRWWMFPDFRGDGIVFDESENPVGLGATTVADITAALELAEETDLYFMFCLFSFNNFRPSRMHEGVFIPGMRGMVTDAARRSLLMNNVVAPVARAVEASPYRHRVFAWDVINEPEWAMVGPCPYGPNSYDSPMRDLETVTHQQMETFVADVIATLRAENSALITVGGSAWKWARAWSGVDIDFYIFMMYAWINHWWPYSKSPAEYGVTDKPVVIGEFPMGDLTPGVSYDTVVSSWFTNGYAGALSWRYLDATPEALDLVAQFAARYPCETRF